MEEAKDAYAKQDLKTMKRDLIEGKYDAIDADKFKQSGTVKDALGAKV